MRLLKGTAARRGPKHKSEFAHQREEGGEGGAADRPIPTERRQTHDVSLRGVVRLPRFYFMRGPSLPARPGSCSLITTLRGAADSAVRRAAAGTRLHFNVFISYANTDPVEPVIIHREPSPSGNDSVLRIYYSWPQTGQAARGFRQNLVRGWRLAAVYLSHTQPVPSSCFSKGPNK